MVDVNVEWARKGEGIFYGGGAAHAAKLVAKAAAGKRKAKGQAEAVHGALRKLVAEIGGNPDSEVFFHDRAKNKANGYGDAYRVGWEGGPFEWAIVASDALGQVGVFAEPYYSFDLMFYPSEDR